VSDARLPSPPFFKQPVRVDLVTHSRLLRGTGGYRCRDLRSPTWM
jgi:hypothetical protein